MFILCDCPCGEPIRISVTVPSNTYSSNGLFPQLLLLRLIYRVNEPLDIKKIHEKFLKVTIET